MHHKPADWYSSKALRNVKITNGYQTLYVFRGVKRILWLLGKSSVASHIGEDLLGNPGENY